MTRLPDSEVPPSRLKERLRTLEGRSFEERLNGIRTIIANRFTYSLEKEAAAIWAVPPKAWLSYGFDESLFVQGMKIPADCDVLALYGMILARSLGIPARLSIGYVDGNRNGIMAGSEAHGIFEVMDPAGGGWKEVDLTNDVEISDKRLQQGSEEIDRETEQDEMPSDDLMIEGYQLLMDAVSAVGTLEGLALLEKAVSLYDPPNQTIGRRALQDIFDAAEYLKRNGEETVMTAEGARDVYARMGIMAAQKLAEKKVISIENIPAYKQTARAAAQRKEALPSRQKGEIPNLLETITSFKEAGDISYHFKDGVLHLEPSKGSLTADLTQKEYTKVQDILSKIDAGQARFFLLEFTIEAGQYGNFYVDVLDAAGKVLSTENVMIPSTGKKSVKVNVWYDPDIIRNMSQIRIRDPSLPVSISGIAVIKPKYSIISTSRAIVYRTLREKYPDIDFTYFFRHSMTRSSVFEPATAGYLLQRLKEYPDLYYRFVEKHEEYLTLLRNRTSFAGRVENNQLSWRGLNSSFRRFLYRENIKALFHDDEKWFFENLLSSFDVGDVPKGERYQERKSWGFPQLNGFVE